MQQNQGLQSIRSCTIVGHKQKAILQICCDELCDQISRWACEECMKNNLHLHSRDKQISLKDQQEFIKYLEQKLKTREDSEQQLFNKIDKIIINLKDMQTEINGLIKFLNNWVVQQKSTNEKQLIKEFKDKIQKDYQQLQTQQIDEIIKITSTLTEINQYQKFDELIQYCLQKFKECQKNDQYFKDNNLEKQKKQFSSLQMGQDKMKQSNIVVASNIQQQPTQITKSSLQLSQIRYVNNNICWNDQRKIQSPAQNDIDKSQAQLLKPQQNLKINQAEGNFGQSRVQPFQQLQQQPQPQPQALPKKQQQPIPLQRNAIQEQNSFQLNSYQQQFNYQPAVQQYYSPAPPKRG